MIVVIDASVALKWFFRARSDESHLDNALAILKGVDTGRVRMLQAPHFLAEVAAVLAREKAGEVHDELSDLQRLEWQVVEDPALYATAVDLSIRLRQHLFDTLYHATALHTEGATLVTADSRYYDAARDVGRITLLADFALPG